MSRAAAHGPIATVYRGNGPPSGSAHAEMSFDELLLKHAMTLGARFIPHRVASVALPSSRTGRAVVGSERGGAEPMETDLIVVACGVNSTLPARLEAMKFGYRRPVSRRACQAEIPLPDDFIDARFGSDILLFALGLGTHPLRGAGAQARIHYADADRLRRPGARRPPVLYAAPGTPRRNAPGWEYAGLRLPCFPLMPVRHASGAGGGPPGRHRRRRREPLL